VNVCTHYCMMLLASAKWLKCKLYKWCLHQDWGQACVYYPCFSIFWSVFMFISVEVDTNVLLQCCCWLAVLKGPGIFLVFLFIPQHERKMWSLHRWSWWKICSTEWHVFLMLWISEFWMFCWFEWHKYPMQFDSSTWFYMAGWKAIELIVQVGSVRDAILS
jgi:hypothetical protein